MGNGGTHRRPAQRVGADEGLAGQHAGAQQRPEKAFDGKAHLGGKVSPEQAFQPAPAKGGKAGKQAVRAAGKQGRREQRRRPAFPGEGGRQQAGEGQNGDCRPPDVLPQLPAGRGGQHGRRFFFRHGAQQIAQVLHVAAHPAVHPGEVGIRLAREGFGDLALSGKGGSQHGPLQYVVAQDPPLFKAAADSPVEGVHVDQPLAREQRAAEQVHVPLRHRRGVGQRAALGQQAGEKGAGGGAQRHLAAGGEASVSPPDDAVRTAYGPVQRMPRRGDQPPQRTEGDLRIAVQRHEVTDVCQPFDVACQRFKAAFVAVPQKCRQRDHRPPLALKAGVFPLGGGVDAPPYRRGEPAAEIPVQPPDDPLHRRRVRRVLRHVRGGGVLFVQQQHHPHALVPVGGVKVRQVRVQLFAVAGGGQQAADRDQHRVVLRDRHFPVHGAQGLRRKQSCPQPLGQGEQRRRKRQPQQRGEKRLARPQCRADGAAKKEQRLQRQKDRRRFRLVLLQREVKTDVPVVCGLRRLIQRRLGKVLFADALLFRAAYHRPPVERLRLFAHGRIFPGGVCGQQLFRFAGPSRQLVKIHVAQGKQRPNAGADVFRRLGVAGQLLLRRPCRFAGKKGSRRGGQQRAVGKGRPEGGDLPRQGVFIRQHPAGAAIPPQNEQRLERPFVAAGQRVPGVLQRPKQRGQIVGDPRRRVGFPSGFLRLFHVLHQLPAAAAQVFRRCFHVRFRKECFRRLLFYGLPEVLTDRRFFMLLILISDEKLPQRMSCLYQGLV